MIKLDSEWVFGVFEWMYWGSHGHIFPLDMVMTEREEMICIFPSEPELIVDETVAAVLWCDYMTETEHAARLWYWSHFEAFTYPLKTDAKQQQYTQSETLKWREDGNQGGEERRGGRDLQGLQNLDWRHKKGGSGAEGLSWQPSSTSCILLSECASKAACILPFH